MHETLIYMIHHEIGMKYSTLIVWLSPLVNGPEFILAQVFVFGKS